ncbi:MAG: MFS transporter [Actinomycetota bacterium]
MSSRLRRFALDVTPLRVSPAYRRLWLGLLASTTGSQFTLVAVFIQLTERTGSAVVVGSSGVAYLVGIVAGTLAFGPVIDVWDRRRLLVLAQVGGMFGVAILLVSSLLGETPLGVIYAGLTIAAFFGALDSPARSAMTPRLIGAELIPSAAALNQVVWNGSGLIGPAVAGVVVGVLGLPVAYAIDVASLGVMLIAALSLPSIMPEGAGESPTGLAAIREGFAFVRSSRLLQSTFVIDLIAMIFGMPRALFTFLIVEQFGRDPAMVGLLFSAPAVGALVGALTSGWSRGVRHQGRAVIAAVAVWGAAIALFGWSGSNLWLGLLALALAGWADVISAIFRSTILQLAVPDRLRGRLSAIHILVVTGGPRLGDLEAGLVARAFSSTFSVISGGIACIVGAGLVAALYPQLKRYHAVPTEPV